MIVSIIIATYNAGSVLNRCINSIRPLIEKDKVELIVIDGGSKDQTIDIIRTNNDIISYYITEPDKGVYDAWNKGIQQSKGEWISFIGADDIICMDNFRQYIEYAKKQINTDYNLLSAKADYLNKKDGLIRVIGNKLNPNVFKKKMDISHVGTLHRKCLFQNNANFNLNYKICADYEFLLRSLKNLRCDFFPKSIVKMQTGGMSFSHKAIFEVYRIRKNLNSVSPILNIYLLLKQIAEFEFFKIRHGLK
ncbi:MAG: glycosyltransferase family 2 protein [Turicibacter sp.]